MSFDTSEIIASLLVNATLALLGLAAAFAWFTRTPKKGRR
jgi:hypothetical protein